MDEINQNDLQSALAYIDSFWNTVTLKPRAFRIKNQTFRRVIMRLPKREVNPHILEVPYSCLVPNTSKYRYVFYWDSYFMFRGVLETKHEWIVPEMVENFIYIYNKYHIIPNFSHPEALGRSQAPFLSSMILDAFFVLRRNRTLLSRVNGLFTSTRHWLKTRMAVAKKEYQNVWESPMGVDHMHYNHKVPEYNLNRYGDRDVGYGQHAEQESGWDMTSRFYNRCDDFLPVDLNCLLYKYEKDFAYTATILEKKEEAEYWESIAQRRKEKIVELMWNEEKGFFYDFDYVHKKQSEFLSLAGFVPLWVGLVTPEQAGKVLKKLKEFQTPYGIAISDQASLPPVLDTKSMPEGYRLSIEEFLKPKQWDYPNIWPPLHYMTVIGLIRYGFKKEAESLMHEYISANLQSFKKYGAFLEKMDGLTGDMPPTYWYPTQLGFGWTNAVFFRYTKILHHLHQTILFNQDGSVNYTV